MGRPATSRWVLESFALTKISRGFCGTSTSATTGRPQANVTVRIALFALVCGRCPGTFRNDGVRASARALIPLTPVTGRSASLALKFILGQIARVDRKFDRGTLAATPLARAFGGTRSAQGLLRGILTVEKLLGLGRLRPGRNELATTLATRIPCTRVRVLGALFTSVLVAGFVTRSR